ncbi:MAG: hypothetical protein WB870_06880 [Gallionellaceae bacterium]
MGKIKRKPTRTEVVKSLRDLAELWRPPDPKCNAHGQVGVGDARKLTKGLTK